MNGLFLLCSIAILATVYAIPPGLSESFYMQATGTLTQTISGTVTTTTDYTRFNYALDTTRELSLSDIVGITNRDEGYVIILTSRNDNLTYIESNGTCETIPYSRNSHETIIYLFGEFTTGVEGPPGTITYTSTRFGITSVLVTVNGLPTSLTYTTTSSTFNLDIHNYTNSAPPFSIFVLSDTCSDLTCVYCYSTAAGVTSSFLLMLAVLAIFLFSTV